MVRRGFQLVTVAGVAGVGALVLGPVGAVALLPVGVAVVAALGPWSWIGCDSPGCGRVFSSVGPVRVTRRYALERGWTSTGRGDDRCTTHSPRGAIAG
ncbi:hypothetical protein [Dactylosporangium sp. CS-033363]|uniref:hypothetical protein n=1 Tax=Dactylosporangium sp. CS-033363 TaxID=3239935 RepID=UPI003D90D51F